MADCPKCEREYTDKQELSSGETLYVHGVREVDVGEATIQSVHDKCLVGDDETDAVGDERSA